MSESTVIAELGDDLDLLFSSDQWLENQSIQLQTRIASLASELDAVLTAQRLKRRLQQQNLVPVCCLDRSAKTDPNNVPSNGLNGIVIKVMPLPDAIVALEADKSDPSMPGMVSKVSAEQQERIWQCDGYDVVAARRLRSKTQ